jgi:uncharacterized protein (DUF362 family)
MGVATTTNPVDDVLVESICGDVRKMLAGWDYTYASRPEVLSRKLWLMALEREQIVVVAYRDDTILRRVEQLDVPEDLRAVIRQTLAWIWKDEEMHVDYARARLAKGARPVSTTVIFGRQLIGAISGWVSSTSNHADRRKDPVRALAARIIVTAGRVTGRVPPLLAKELSHQQTFRGYCALNVALEESAALGYELLMKHVAPAALDERRHQQAFRVLAAAIDETGHLRSSVGAQDVISQLADISPFHVPSHVRDSGTRTMKRPVHQVSRSDSESNDLDQTLWPMLDAIGLNRAVCSTPRGSVAIKAAFMLGYHRNDRSNIGSPLVVDSIARYSRQHGATDVVVIEAPTIYDRYYANRSVQNVAEYFGFVSPNYRIVDASTDQEPAAFDRGLSQQTLSSTWVDADVRIVVSKLRGDPTEIAHLSFSTMQGMGDRTDTLLHIDREIDMRTAVMMTLDLAPPDFGVVDAWGTCGDGPLGVMGCRTPATLARFWAGNDIVSLDAAVIADLGDDPSNSIMLRRARDWFGVDLGVDLGSVEPIDRSFQRRRATVLGRFICATAYPMYLFGSNRGALFVPEFDETAFPQRKRPRFPTRFIRRSAQLAFGLRPGQQG